MVALAFASLLLAGVAPAAAQVAPGVQAGISNDPDQFFAGAHVETRPLVDQLRFRPGVDFGFGDHATLVAGNLDFVYRLPFPQSSWALQVGGGPAVNFFKFDRHSDVEAGFNLLLGVRHREGFFTELRVGMMDSPDLKFAIGYTFR
ncbi:MAG: hypothetical protein HYZ58_07595 [Acidobacteria bacterium]|nr:hypothetical protein [Acidobacteriota bacterium]